jgi:hypothetical protein
VTRAGLRECAAVQRERYQRARRPEKRQLLDEIVAVTGIRRGNCSTDEVAAVLCGHHDEMVAFERRLRARPGRLVSGARLAR